MYKERLYLSGEEGAGVKMFKYLKAHGAGVLYGILLIGFTIYLLMDTFLVSKVYRAEEKTEQQNPIQKENESEDVQENLVNEEVSKTSYDDGKILVDLQEYREEGTNIYVADIVLSSSEYLKTAFAQNMLQGK